MSLFLLNNIDIMYTYFAIYNVEFNAGDDHSGNKFLTFVCYPRCFLYVYLLYVLLYYIVCTFTCIIFTQINQILFFLNAIMSRMGYHNDV